MRTKIVCTIGPNTESEEMIKQLIENGMDIARLNFSHDTHKNQGARIDRIRKWSKKLNKDVKILCDLQGPKIRVQDFPNPPKKLIEGKIVTVTSTACSNNHPADIIIEDPYVHSDVTKGDVIMFDDGQIELEVLSIDDCKIKCRVVIGGKLYPKKGVNLPYTETTTSSLTDKDLKDLEFILTKAPDWIAISFVQNKDDVLNLRKLVKSKKIKIMCKIERAKAIENLASIIREADGIMVARGDLGVELPIEKLPLIQKQIIQKSNYAETPVVTATHMLSTMTENPYPTRAEVTDIANAVIDGTDAVMMSNETTIGKYPLEALKTMRKIVEATEDYLFNRKNKL